jgi:hypothetical protein
VPLGTEILLMNIDELLNGMWLKSSWLLLRRSIDDVEAFERIGCIELIESVREAEMMGAYMYDSGEEMEIRIL